MTNLIDYLFGADIEKEINHTTKNIREARLFLEMSERKIFFQMLRNHLHDYLYRIGMIGYGALCAYNLMDKECFEAGVSGTLFAIASVLNSRAGILRGNLCNYAEYKALMKRARES